MSAPKGRQATFDCLLCVRHARRCSKTLSSDRTNGCQSIFDAVVEFAHNELLQIIGSFAFLGFDACLPQKQPSVDARLLKQKPQTVIFRRQCLLSVRQLY